MSLLRATFFHNPRQQALILSAALGGAVFGLTTPYAQKLFIDTLTGTSNMTVGTFSASPVFWISLAFVTTVLAHLSNQTAIYLASKESVRYQAELGETLYRKTLALHRDTPHPRTVGEIVAIYATDVPGAATLIEQTWPTAAAIFFPLVLAPLAMRWLYHLPLWPTLLTMIVVFMINTGLSLRQSRFFYRFKQLAAERVGLVNEWVQNMRALRILGWMADFEAKIFRKREEETANRVAMVTNGQSMNALASCITFFINISGAASLIYFNHHPVQPGELLALLWIFGVFLVRPFRQMPWFFVFLLDALSSIRRVEAFLEAKDISEADELQMMAQLPERIKGQPGLDVQRLNLSIGQHAILKDISIKVNPGEFIAIVGEVGSGKSLLLNSLMRETNASMQLYTLGACDARELSTSTLRSHFAMVAQDSFVMSATLRENIGFEYDVPPTDDTDISRSLELAQFDARTESLAYGLETEIGERGVNLSGGQRQRVSLARGIHTHHPIILLDDCLSAVDVDTERKIVSDLLLGEWRNQTRVLVTHRLSVLEHVDRIIFLKDGRIKDEGSLEALLKRSADFRDFTLTINKMSQTNQTEEAARGTNQIH